MVNKQAFASTSELYVLSKPLNGRLKIQDSQVSMYVKELNSLMHLHCLLRQNIGPYFHYCLSNVHYCEDHFHVHFFVRSSHVWSSYLYSHLHTTPRVYLETNIMTSSSWLVQSVVRALQQYRRGHGFKSRTGLIFPTAYVVFCASFSQPLLGVWISDKHSSSCLIYYFTNMIFAYLQSMWVL